MTRRFKIALLGCGRVSARYCEVFADELVDCAELVAACDSVPEKARDVVAVAGGAAVDTLDALLAFEPDLVCVLTESGHHARDALQLIERGCNVLVEKPVALRIEDAVAMRDAARRAGVVCAVVKQNRYNPAMRFLRTRIEEGGFGRLIAVEMRVHWCRLQDYYEDGWHGRWAMDGGVLAQQAIHHLDALQWLGGAVEAVCATGTAALNRLEAEDTAAAILRFRSGALGTILATTAARDIDFEASLQLVGEKARARIGGPALNLLESWYAPAAGGRDAALEARHSQDVPSSYGLGHGPLIRDVLAAVEQGGTPPVDVDDALASLRLVHALYQSMETGGWVDLAAMTGSARLGIGG